MLLCLLNVFFCCPRVINLVFWFRRIDCGGIHYHFIRCNQPTIFFNWEKPATNHQPASNTLLSQQISINHSTANRVAVPSILFPPNGPTLLYGMQLTESQGLVQARSKLHNLESGAVLANIVIGTLAVGSEVLRMFMERASLACSVRLSY